MHDNWSSFVIPIVQPVTAALACITVYIRAGGKIPGLKLSMQKLKGDSRPYFIYLLGNGDGYSSLPEGTTE